MCMLAVAACVDVIGSTSGRRCHLLNRFILQLGLYMYVVSTIFVISVSNSLMFTYQDKWNSHSKIVNSYCPFMVARLVYFIGVLFAHWICDYSTSVNIIRSIGKVGSIYWLNVGNYKFWMLILVLYEKMNVALLCIVTRLISDVHFLITAPKLTFNSLV